MPHPSADAVPIRLGQECGAYRRLLDRDIERIRGVGRHLAEVKMGATAAGTGLNADPAYIQRVVQYLAELSGCPIVSAGDLVDATQNTDGYTEISAKLKVCMMNLSKIANDLRLMGGSSSGRFPGPAGERPPRSARSSVGGRRLWSQGAGRCHQGSAGVVSRRSHARRLERDGRRDV